MDFSNAYLGENFALPLDLVCHSPSYDIWPDVLQTPPMHEQATQPTPICLPPQFFQEERRSQPLHQISADSQPIENRSIVLLNPHTHFEEADSDSSDSLSDRKRTDRNEAMPRDPDSNKRRRKGPKEQKEDYYAREREEIEALRASGKNSEAKSKEKELERKIKNRDSSAASRARAKAEREELRKLKPKYEKLMAQAELVAKLILPALEMNSSAHQEAIKLLQLASENP